MRLILMLFCLVQVSFYSTQLLAQTREFSKLGKLAPFNDIAVIQRNYLPKTHRFQFSGSLTSALNDAFFMSSGFVGRLGYHFSEVYGIEGNYMYLNSSERKVVGQLRDTYGLTPENTLVTPQSYQGVAFKWTPLYGKVTYRDRTIIPYDTYFSAGFGLSKTNHGYSEQTLELGTGQNFALSKSVSFCWDFIFHYYNARYPLEEKVGTVTRLTGELGSQRVSNLFILVGMSIFFPEADYR